MTGDLGTTKPMMARASSFCALFWLVLAVLYRGVLEAGCSTAAAQRPCEFKGEVPSCGTPGSPDLDTNGALCRLYTGAGYITHGEPGGLLVGKHACCLYGAGVLDFNCAARTGRLQIVLRQIMWQTLRRKQRCWRRVWETYCLEQKD